ncbi:MAG: hypothetical protein ABI625_28165, partial [bacterium]
MTNRIRRVLGGRLVLLLTLSTASVVATGCDREAPYRIGVVLDVDGVRGARLAAEQVNASGGFNGAGPDRDAIREWLSHVGRGQAAFSGISGSIAL